MLYDPLSNCLVCVFSTVYLDNKLDESTIYKAVQKVESADFEVKVLETDFHIGVELSKYSIPIDWTCYRVHEESILQYPGVKIPVHLYESLGSVPLLGKTFFVPDRKSTRLNSSHW